VHGPNGNGMLPAMAHVNSRGTIYAFEGIDAALSYLPLAARRTLDALGQHLSLEGWLSLAMEARWRLIGAGSGEHVEPGAAAVLSGANPGPAPSAVFSEPDPSRIPRDLLASLGAVRSIEDARWSALRPLDRYVLVKCSAKPEKVAAAYDEIFGNTVRRMPHLTAAGHAHMVDVGSKPVTARRAVASASVRSTPTLVSAVAGGALPKGDVLAAARIAGLFAAKRTSEIVPLCHPVSTTAAFVEFELAPAEGEIRVRATVEAVDRTGVEMEAMVAASVAALTIYDMIKGSDRWATIDAVRLEEKSGGKSGYVQRPAESDPR
jgi:cyclic pyranopterin phosphate synthase